MADVLRQRERQAQALYGAGRYQDAISVADEVYAQDACREHNLLLLGAAHFQLRQLPESCFFSQQALRIDPQNAEAFSNLGNALKELGDVRGSVAFFLKAIKCSPRFAAAYNNLAAAHTQLGESQSAKEAYEMALVLDPALVEAHCNLGNLHKAKGQGALARKCYMEAIRLQPGAAIAWSNLAGLFKDEGQVATSVAYYREALRLAPSCADFYSNLGAALQDQRNLGEARTCFETALELRSDYAVARGNLGACLLAQGEYAGAVKSLRQALQLEPNFPDAFNNLGSALSALAKGDDPGTRQQHLDESVASYRACLRLQPDHPHAYSNLGVALQKRGMVREAVHCFVSAARLMPSFAPAHANLASLLREQGAMDQALAHYHQSIALDPSFAAAYSALGDAYRELRQPDDALDCYATALKIDPKSAAALTAQGAALLDKSDFPAAAAAFRSALAVDGNASEGAALAGLLRASDASCSWEGRWALLERLSVVLEKELQNDGFDDHLMDAKILQRTNESAQTRALAAPNAPAQLGDVPPFFGPLPSAQPFDCLALTQIVSPRDAQRVARRFAARAKASLALAGDAAEKHKAFSLKGPLRVGYISANFGNTPTGFLLCPAVPLHSNAIQATCYALQPPDGSDARHELERKVPGGVVDVSSLTARQVAQAISRDGIQVLVHCDGHGDGSRLEILALRPAPIQVTLACGFAGTLGADYVDYVVVDDVVAISGEGLDEARMTLSTCVINGRSLKFHNAPTCTRHDLGLPDDAFVFAFFGPLSHLDPTTFDVWCGILKRVPNSLLWLVGGGAEANLRANALARGVRGEQLFFTDSCSKTQAVSRSAVADVCLDTAAANAFDSALDALWGGTPVVCLLGATVSTRMTASLCRAANAPELVAQTLDEYEDLAVKLAVDTDVYFAVRAQLENGRAGTKKAPLFDTHLQVSQLEQGYAAAWALHQRGLQPQDISLTQAKTEA